jgi:predicted dehydrogenase
MPVETPRLDQRCLVLGCGSIGLRHIQNLLALRVKEVFAFDVSAERSQAARAELGIDIAENLEAAWARRPQVVLIATSTQTHIPLALQAATRGCHLFIEKPLSYAEEGLGQLAAEVEQRQLVTMVGCNMRFHPGPATVKKLIEANAIGDVIAARIQTGSYLPGWRPQQDYRQSYSASPDWGGAILDCIHEIDLAWWYLGAAKVLAAAHLSARSIGLETDGLAEIILAHRSGALSNVHLNFIQRDYCRVCQIIGSEGTIYWDFGSHQVQLYGLEGKLKQTYPEPAGWQINQMYLDELRHFLQSVRRSAPTTNPVAEGAAVLQIALEARNRGKQVY